MELKVPTAHRQAAGLVAWRFLAVLRQASLDVQDQAQQVQQLQCQEEISTGIRAGVAERMPRGPDGSLLLSGSPLLIPRQVQPAIRQQVDVEQPLALGGQAGGDPPPPRLNSIPP